MRIIIINVRMKKYTFPPVVCSLVVALAIGSAANASFAADVAGAGAASFDVDGMVIPAELPEKDVDIKSTPDGPWTGVWTRSSLLGDMGGLRGQLARDGITVGLTETSEVLSTLQGGLAQGAAYQGLTTLTLGLDTLQAGAWAGGAFNVSVLQVHGRPFSPEYVGSLNTASGIEADAGTRLWEAWYQQKMLDGAVDIKAGQQSIDQEFMVNPTASVFMGTMFGWPGLPSYDMPSGGPAYPLSALGLRLRASLGHQTTLLLGAFAGNPSNATAAQDPQKVDATGTSFYLGGGTLYLAELQFGHNQPDMGEMDTGHNKGLPGTYKMGAWYHDARFADMEFDAAGLSLANPASSASPLQHTGNYSVYALADQMVWRESEDGARAVNVFARVMTAPGDRNLLSLSADFGITMTAPFVGRDSDVVGLGVCYAQVGSAAEALERDANTFNSTNLPVQSSETLFEGTYQYQMNPWWQVQGALQYVLRPGAGAVNPSDPTQTGSIPNAWALGLRTNITF